ncbi:MAG: hypothetical protein H6523_10905 [Mycolicibacterium sp.]|nr:hypothetical protein [Mycobacterium sp.]MCB9440745.1 hypothetical protein [Mycolicibacterium sp.]
MSGADETSTRPISVAELLAKNGTIGSPPVGGRRRRRRGNADAVTVAELTGEIPIIRTGEMPVVTEDDLKAADAAETEAAETEAAAIEAPEAEAPEVEAPAAPEETPAASEEPAATAEPTAEEPAEQPESLSELPPARAHTPSPRRGREARPERSRDPRPVRRSIRPLANAAAPAAVEVVTETETAVATVGETADAELMSPDLIDDADFAAEFESDADDALFGGDSVVDELARRRSEPLALLNPGPAAVSEETEEHAGAVEDTADEDDEDYDDEPLTRGQQILRGSVIAFQSIFAVAFGAGLFLAFDQLWQWNNIIALVLSVLVILGLVVGVRVVRKTEDIVSTLIAVVVGAMVTLGPLALQHSS